MKRTSTHFGARVTRRFVLASSVSLALLSSIGLSACSTGSTPEKQATSTASPTDNQPVTDSGLPFDAMPALPSRNDSTPCPYLETQWVADTNGQRVLGQGIDDRFSTPACIFYSYPDEPQLTVIVRDMPSEDEAIRVVDWAAPIDTTDPAEEPEGWSGGRQGSPGRALYAVQKGDRAVVVFSNQDQSLKAELVAKEAIKNLGL